MTEAAVTPLIRGVNLTKVYGNFVALSDANISVAPGEVRALIGSNGAGKSTLVKVLTGAVTPTLGSVELGGVPAPLGDPRAMMKLGLACIYQHSNLAPAMSVPSGEGGSGFSAEPSVRSPPMPAVRLSTTSTPDFFTRSTTSS